MTGLLIAIAWLAATFITWCFIFSCRRNRD